LSRAKSGNDRAASPPLPEFASLNPGYNNCSQRCRTDRPNTSRQRAKMDDKTGPDETGYRFIGKPMPRKEDARLITGKGRFTDEFSLPGETSVMVRQLCSTHRINGNAVRLARSSAAASASPCRRKFDRRN
jgi:hypothetical protein